MRFGLFLSQLLGTWWQGALALLLLFAAARGVGCWLLPRRRGEFVRIALGMAVLAWLYPWWWRGIPGWCGAVLAFPAARGVWDIPWRELRRDWRPYAVLCLFGAATLGSALLPPFVWDEQVYQTVLWARFPEAFGRIDNPYSAYPLLPQWFLMWVRAWGGLYVPRLAVWLLSLLLAGKLYMEAARRSRSPAFGAVAAACVMLAPTALILHQGFYAESFIALFALAGFSVLEDADERSGGMADGHREIVAGVFAGACAAVKLTGVGAALMLAVFALKRHGFWRFAASAALTALPFFIRPWLTFGNPFYPFGSAWWGGEKARLVETIFRGLGDFGPGKIAGACFGWLSVCLADVGLHDGVWGGGVLALTVLLFVGLFRCRDRAFLLSVAALAAGYLFWALTSQQSRFIYPLVFPLALLLADRFPDLAERRVRLTVLLLPVLGMALSCNLMIPRLRHHLTAWRLLPMAERDPAALLAAVTRDPAYFNALKRLGETAPERARVLLLFERRGLYVPRAFEHGSPMYQEAHLTPVPVTADGLWREIKDFDYLLFGSGCGRIDHLKDYDPVERLIIGLTLELERRGKVIRIRSGPEAGPMQPLFEVVRERP